MASTLPNDTAIITIFSEMFPQNTNDLSAPKKAANFSGGKSPLAHNHLQLRGSPGGLSGTNKCGKSKNACAIILTTGADYTCSSEPD